MYDVNALLKPVYVERFTVVIAYVGNSSQQGEQRGTDDGTIPAGNYIEYSNLLLLCKKNPLIPLSTGERRCIE